MRKIGKLFGLLSLALIWLAVDCYAMPVTVTFTGVDTSKAAVRDGAWAGFYKLSMDGDQILGMCDDYSTEVDTSKAGWQGELNTYTDILNGDGRWGTPVSDYNVIGYLFMQAFDTDLNYIADLNLMADINLAIWKVHNSSLVLTGKAAELYNQALNYADFTGWYGFMDVITPEMIDGVPVSQEFLVRGAGPAPVPEPATLLLLGGGLIGLAAFGKNKIRKQSAN